MNPVNGADWLDAIHRHYERTMCLPVLVGAELLLGRADAEAVFESLGARGALAGDPDLADVI